MDAEERLVWRDLVDAADAGALAIWTGQADPFAELQTLLALHNRGLTPGYYALIDFHRQRARQSVGDGEWRLAHQAAADFYSMKAHAAEVEIGRLVDGAPGACDDGLTAGRAIVELGSVIGDEERDGPIAQAWGELRVLGLTSGSRYLATRLLEISAEELTLGEAMVLRGLAEVDEVARWSEPFARYMEYLYATSFEPVEVDAVTEQLETVIRRAAGRDLRAVNLIRSVLDYWEVHIPEDVRASLGW